MTLHLIAHLVRGAPAFDIARRCDSMGTADDPGPWWIVPTSGHRAYPYWHCELAQFGCGEHKETFVRVYDLDGAYEIELDPPPAGWPDHYSCNDTPAAIEDILAIIGRKPAAPAIRRRV